MRRLQLYETEPLVPLSIAAGPKLPRYQDCRVCPLGGVSRTTCMPAEALPDRGGAGSLLVLAANPGSREDRVGRPFYDDAGAHVRRLLEKNWAGSAVLDYTVKCAGDISLANGRCSPYMRQVFVEANPDRVIILGHVAAQQALGRYIPTDDTRKCYSWERNAAGELIPVFVVGSPDKAATNRFLRKYFEEDFAWACTVDVSTLMKPPYDGYFHIVETPEDAREAAEQLRANDWISTDLEWAGKVFSDFFKVVSISCTPAEEDTAWVWDRAALENPEVRAPVLELMEDFRVGKVGHNLKSDRLALRAGYGTVMQGFVLDTQLTRHLELPGCNGTLEVCSELVGMGGYKQEHAKVLTPAKEQIKYARKKSNKGRQLSLLQEDEVLVAAIANPHEDVEAYAYGLVKSDALSRYNARDTISTRRLALSRFGFQLVQKHPPARNIWRNVVRNATESVEQIEAWGISADAAGIARFSAYVQDQLRKSSAKFEKYNVNLASPAQVSALLFDKLKLRNPHARPGDRSTDAAALKAMKDLHPVVADIIEHRRLDKLNSSYSTLDKHIRLDGRIHPSFKIDGTRTGRMSCTDPGLHQIPRGEDATGNSEGKLLKDCFVAAPGRRLAQLDFSQLEYRMAAILSGDPVMRQMLLGGSDFHMQTARLISPLMWGIPADQAGKAQRSASKSFNFGLLFGMTDKTIAAMMKCSEAEAAKLRATIMGQWSVLAAFIDECVRQAKRTGKAYTYWNGELARERTIYEIGNLLDDKNSNGARITATNGAFNTPVQGSASDWMLASICQLVNWLLHSNVDAKLVLTVHDSVIFDTAEDDVDIVVKTAKEIMTSYDSRGVPVLVDADVGQAWGSLESYDKAA